MITHPLIVISCHICGRPVQLEKAVSNETGKAVHSECYLRSICADVHDDDPPPPGPGERRWFCEI